MTGHQVDADAHQDARGGWESIERMLSKRTLATVSFAIERAAAELGSEAVLVSGFQYRPYTA